MQWLRRSLIAGFVVTVPLIITVAAIFPPSIYTIMGILGLTGWVGIARFIRGEFLKVRAQDFVTAARAIGASDRRVMFRHILPNAVAPVLVAMAFGVASAILTESGLSFLGIGLPITEPSLGLLIKNGFDYMLSGNYWISFYPGVALLITIVSINLVGDQLRDVLNPRLRR